MYKAIKDRIIVKLDKAETERLIISKEHNFRYTGTVVGVGEEVRDVSVGDRIIFRIFHEIDLPEQDLVAIREKSVLGILAN